ncbi:hypothetical protein GX51_05135 [Blastomyces parvus]|uniref:Uncharacterized protein n=1 Tax=Blastomyces parvus TaxID=2060905 RepID=A0A2B7WY93_9EURO|nr:hypothetical protein GX51_05135 [Blastomyces parvus]
MPCSLALRLRVSKNREDPVVNLAAFWTSQMIFSSFQAATPLDGTSGIKPRLYVISTQFLAPASHISQTVFRVQGGSWIWCSSLRFVIHNPSGPVATMSMFRRLAPPPLAQVENQYHHKGTAPVAFKEAAVILAM